MLFGIRVLKVWKNHSHNTPSDARQELAIKLEQSGLHRQAKTVQRLRLKGMYHLTLTIWSYMYKALFLVWYYTIQLLYQTVVSAKQRHYEYRLLYIRHSEPWSVITGAFERLLRQNYDLYPFSLLCKSCYAVLVTSSKDQKSTCTSEICPTSYYWKSYMYMYMSLFLGVILLTDNSNPAIVKY